MTELKAKWHDEDGLKWLDNDKRDLITLTTAIIDGMNQCDYVMYEVPPISEIETIDSTDELAEILKKYPDTKRTVAKILNYLSDYMEGTFKVYRGMSFDKNYIGDMTGEKYDNESILKMILNTRKTYNSYTTNPEVAYQFAGVQKHAKTTTGIVIEADASPSCINFAYTAYLMGTVLSPGEAELNITDESKLKNIKIIENQDF